MGSSNRGGSRIRKKNLSTDVNNTSPTAGGLTPLQEDGGLHYTQSQAQRALPNLYHAPLESHTSQPPPTITMDVDEGTSSPSESATAVPQIPRNPSDAWQLLKDVAKSDLDKMNSTGALRGIGQMNGLHGEPRGSINGQYSGIHTYRLVREGYIRVDTIHMLVKRYAEHYHPYLPLVPRRFLDPVHIDTFALDDKHLLTAVLTIASKDLPEESQVHLCCSRYMHDLISGIAAGHDCEVEAVEALLLLAEWEPQGLRNNIEVVGRGEEDRSAWMHVGIALRTGYFLALDRTAFRQESAEEARIDGRKRLAWANCYVSDRLISVRIGRAFWSRGPGPMTGLSEQDFPSLQPLKPGDEDYAKIFQAILDLTQLYSNVHDVLYSGMRTSGQMMLVGDYVKYVDEFRMALARWNRMWGKLECSPHIKATIRMSYEYLCLYTNAFVFQAAISQALSKRPKGDTQSLRDHLRQAFSNVGAMPDARFIWASLAAAKGYLSLLTTVDPVKHLRYMPLRFYLYSIYSAVFLYKARSYGVLDAREDQQVRNLIYQTVDVLRAAGVTPQDPGSRYARLLELLWMKTKNAIPMHSHVPSSPHGSDAQLSSSGSLTMDAMGNMQFSPTNDFSWLDLEAVGDFVSGDLNNNMLVPMAGFPATSAPYLPQDNNMQWQQPNVGNWQPIDMQGNLFF